MRLCCISAQALQLKDRAGFNSGTQIWDQMLVVDSLILLNIWLYAKKKKKIHIQLMSISIKQHNILVVNEEKQI